MIVARRALGDPSSPPPRPTGPPGIDWTAATPECRECWRRWLSTDLPAGRLLSRKTQAALAAAALTLSASTPTVGVAASHHPGDDRGASPKQAGPDDRSDPNFDPGGPENDPPPAPNVPDEPDDPDAGPSTPAPDTPGDPLGDGADAAPPDEEPAPPPDEAPAPPAPPSDDDVTPTPAAASAPPRAGAATAIADVSSKRTRPERHVVYTSSARSHRSVTIRPPARAARPVPKAPASTVAAVTRTVASAHLVRVQRGQHSHVVRPGESLWSIASDLLGHGATAARISREVERLWQANNARIQSGDPDLITAGTTLILS